MKVLKRILKRIFTIYLKNWRRHTKDMVYLHIITILLFMLLIGSVARVNAKMVSDTINAPNGVSGSNNEQIAGNHAFGEQMESLQFNDWSERAMNICLADMQKYGASYEMLKSVGTLWALSYEFDVNPLLACSVMFAETKYGTAGSGRPPRYNPYGIGNYEQPQYLGTYEGAHHRFVNLITFHYIPYGKDDITSISRVYCPYSPIGIDGMSAWERNVTNKYLELHNQI